MSFGDSSGSKATVFLNNKAPRGDKSNMHEVRSGKQTERRRRSASKNPSPASREWRENSKLKDLQGR